MNVENFCLTQFWQAWYSYPNEVVSGGGVEKLGTICNRHLWRN